MQVAMTQAEVMKLVKGDEVEIVDLRFIDFPGIWHHFSVSPREFDEAIFQRGIGFDGSSIRGWQGITESDMILKPIAESAFIDPFCKHKTLAIVCAVFDPVTGQAYTRDPRNVAAKAERYLRESGIGDVCHIGPEAEFFIFDHVAFDQKENGAYYEVDSSEGKWNSGARDVPNLGYKVPIKGGYFPVPPMDQQQDLRSEIMLEMERIGIQTETHHHEVATGGQGEIDFRFRPLVEAADALMKCKYIVKGCAARYGKTATFMPKPLFGDNGSGLHVNLSIWKDGKNLFAGNEYAGLSKTALYAIGGILQHTPALLAFTNPTTNSYRRLIPNYEAPVNVTYSARNRSVAIRVPMYSSSENTKRIELRTPDASSNPYLAFAAILMAATDGIRNRIDPGKPIDGNGYELSAADRARTIPIPKSLDGALDALRRDHTFLLEGGVFTQDVIDTWQAYKTASEVDAIHVRPHPWEFALYFDV